jgi:hypothetical protein
LKSLDVADKMLLDVVGVALQLFEVQRRMVVEPLPGCLVKVRVERIAFEFPSLALRVLGQDLGFRRGEHAVETSQDGHGEHDALVLGWAIWASQ